jgi:hypothetical protein
MACTEQMANRIRCDVCVQKDKGTDGQWRVHGKMDRSTRQGIDQVRCKNSIEVEKIARGTRRRRKRSEQIKDKTPETP